MAFAFFPFLLKILQQFQQLLPGEPKNIQEPIENPPKSEPAREASKAAHSLSIKGWNISTIWTPARLDIKEMN
jgi:hypothetical protein